MKSAKSKHNIANKRSVSMPSELFEQADKRAAELNRTFSNYLQTLVQADLAAGKSEAAK